MVDFKKGIYTGVFEYVDVDGIKQRLLINPLKGKDYKKIWGVMSKFSSMSKEQGDLKEQAEDFFKAISDEDVEKIHDVCSSCLSISYPGIDKSELEFFVSSHLFPLFLKIVEITFPEDKK